MLPFVAGLLQGGYCLLAEGDGGLEGPVAFVDGAEPDQGHALGPGIGGLAGRCKRLLQAVVGLAELPAGKAGNSLYFPSRPLAVPVTCLGVYREGILAALDGLV